MSDKTELDPTVGETDAEVVSTAEEVTVDVVEETQVTETNEIDSDVAAPMVTDDELLEEEMAKEPPAYKGTWEAVTNVEIVTEILERNDVVNDSAVVFTNHSLKDLHRIRNALWNQITAIQDTRRQLPASVLNEGYKVVPEWNFVITDEESTVIELITNSIDNLLDSPQVDSIKKGQWTNLPKHGDRPCAITLLSNHKDPVRKIRARLAIRNEVSTFLVHSGIHVEFESTSALDTSLLLDRIVEERAEAARETMGYSLETTDVQQNIIIMNFAYDNIVNTSLGEISKDAFEDMVSVFDIDNIKIALASTLYRAGFEIFRSCISDKLGKKEPCGHRDSFTVHPRRTRIVHWERLSEQQRVRATRADERVDVKTVASYKANLNPTVSKFVSIGDELFLKLRDPSYADYKRIANSWVNIVVDAAKQLPSIDSNGDNPRKAYIARSNERAKIMRLAHFVEGIYTKSETDDDYVEVISRVKDKMNATRDDVIEKDNEVDKILMDLPHNGKSHELAVTGIEEFITDYNLSLFVLAKTHCSKCDAPHEVIGEEVGPDLLVIDPGEVFFTLLLLKTDGVQ